MASLELEPRVLNEGKIQRSRQNQSIQQYSFQSRGNKTSQVDFDFGVFATILYTDCLSATSDRRLEENLSTQLPRKLRIQSFVTKL